MKKNNSFKLMTIFIAVLSLSLKIIAQAPQALPYQAAARNNSGVIIPNKTIALRFSVHDAIATGTIVYKETQYATTNTLGMFIVNIGQGSSITGTFVGINWGVGAKFMQVELDTTATGNSYTDMGTQQLLSVPYALNSGNGVPVGTVVAFMGTSPPAGWLLCNGAAISRSTYSILWAVLGTSCGYGDNSTTFNLPDLRGKFLRGMDAGAGFDPDITSRTAITLGGNTGDNIGSYQSDAFQGHLHSQYRESPSVISGAVAFGNTSSTDRTDNVTNHPTSGPIADGTNGSPRTSSETRPRNINVNYIIRY